MARALICDACEAHAPVAHEGALPPGWLDVRLRGEPGTSTIHACSGGCAVRALATLLHDEGKALDERDRCLIAGCQNPAMPLRSCCSEHEPELAVPCDVATCDRPVAGGSLYCLYHAVRVDGNGMVHDQPLTTEA